jgi:heme exporter protein A
VGFNPVIDSKFSLELSAVGLSRGGRQLISDLSFSLQSGQLALLMGPNGSGKTTLLRAVAGLAAPSAGTITLQGHSVLQCDAEVRSRIAYLGHLEGMKKDLSIEENLLFINGLRESSDSVDELLNELDLRPLARRSLRQLSAGQKRRVALAALRAAHASLWLLDEPLTNLDRAGRQLLSRWLDAHLASGGMAVVATHMAEDLKRPGCLLVEL